MRRSITINMLGTIFLRKYEENKLILIVDGNSLNVLLL